MRHIFIILILANAVNNASAPFRAPSFTLPGSSLHVATERAITSFSTRQPTPTLTPVQLHVAQSIASLQPRPPFRASQSTTPRYTSISSIPVALQSPPSFSPPPIPSFTIPGVEEAIHAFSTGQPTPMLTPVQLHVAQSISSLQPRPPFRSLHPTPSFTLPPSAQIAVERGITSFSRGTQQIQPQSVLLTPSPSSMLPLSTQTAIKEAIDNTKVNYSDIAYVHKITICSLTSGGLAVPNSLTSITLNHYQVIQEELKRVIASATLLFIPKHIKPMVLEPEYAKRKADQTQRLIEEIKQEKALQKLREALKFDSQDTTGVMIRRWDNEKSWAYKKYREDDEANAREYIRIAQKIDAQIKGGFNTNDTYVELLQNLEDRHNLIESRIQKMHSVNEEDRQKIQEFTDILTRLSRITESLPPSLNYCLENAGRHESEKKSQQCSEVILDEMVRRQRRKELEGVGLTRKQIEAMEAAKKRARLRALRQ